MSQLAHSPKYEDTLRHTAITSEAPGTILHDFQVMLDFVAEEATYLTNAHMLPMKALQLLNNRLIRRIEHRLARPQQKSFPHINGLFLLLRASGLTVVEDDGRKPLLIIDPLAADSWHSLTPDERYFSLLESWLMRGDSAIIGEERRSFEIRPPLLLWGSFFQRLERQAWRDDDWIERVRYEPGFHHLALIELFGLVTIEDAPPRDQKGWQISDVRTTEWGEALLGLLTSQLSEAWKFWEKLSHSYDYLPGEMQPFIQPYRPQWQHTLQLPKFEFQEGTFVFKASLDTNLWRQIFIPAQSTLDDLSKAILEAYLFDDDHLYRFLYSTRFGTTAEILHPYIDGDLSTDEVRIGDLPARPGFSMIFNYDFGDNWLFEVLLERIDPPDPKVKAYRIGKRQGRSPEQYSYD